MVVIERPANAHLHPVEEHVINQFYQRLLMVLVAILRRGNYINYNEEQLFLNELLYQIELWAPPYAHPTFVSRLQPAEEEAGQFAHMMGMLYNANGFLGPGIDAVGSDIAPQANEAVYDPTGSNAFFTLYIRMPDFMHRPLNAASMARSRNAWLINGPALQNLLVRYAAQGGPAARFTELRGGPYAIGRGAGEEASNVTANTDTYDGDVSDDSSSSTSSTRSSMLKIYNKDFDAYVTWRKLIKIHPYMEVALLSLYRHPQHFSSLNVNFARLLEHVRNESRYFPIKPASGTPLPPSFEQGVLCLVRSEANAELQKKSAPGCKRRIYGRKEHDFFNERRYEAHLSDPNHIYHTLS